MYIHNYLVNINPHVHVQVGCMYMHYINIHNETDSSAELQSLLSFRYKGM